MGIEADLYHYLPAARNAERLPDVLRDLGVEGIARLEESAYSYYVLKGTDYWLDFQVGRFGAAYNSVSIRVALCSPDGVLPVLRRVFSHLLANGGGYVQDANSNILDVLKAGGRRYTMLDDESWQRFEAAFKARKAQFQFWFGTAEAPISADEALRFVRSHHSGGSEEC